MAHVFSEYGVDERFNITYEFNTYSLTEIERVDYEKVVSGMDLINSLKLSLTPVIQTEEGGRVLRSFSTVMSKNSLVSAYSGLGAVQRIKAVHLISNNLIYLPAVQDILKRILLKKDVAKKYLKDNQLPWSG